MSRGIENLINTLINEILITIKNKKVDVFDLCNRLFIEPDLLINYLTNPRKNISLYSRILTEVYFLSGVQHE